MDTHDIFIQGLNKTIEFYIGKNAKNNEEIIDLSKDDDIWFHVKDMPSCHVIAIISDDINKKDLKYIIKKGAFLCKYHSKYTNIKNLDIVYTKIKYVTKTDKEGSVNITNEKIISI
jgi:predicted ribosome quality control (RQC) complex YloA/Tae2 family protein